MEVPMRDVDRDPPTTPDVPDITVPDRRRRRPTPRPVMKSGGLMDNAFEWIIENGGVDSENQYRYKASFDECKTRKTLLHIASIDGFNDVPSNDESALKKAVAQQPVSVAIEADQRSFQLYGGGVYHAEDCGTQLDHGVLVVGYGIDHNSSNVIIPGATKKYWKI